VQLQSSYVRDKYLFTFISKLNKNDPLTVTVRTEGLNREYEYVSQATFKELFRSFICMTGTRKCSLSKWAVILTL